MSDFGQIQALTEERDALRKEVERLKTVPMKYRRMAFNAQLQEENKALRERVEALEKALQTLLIERDGHYSTAAAWEAARAAAVLRKQAQRSKQLQARHLVRAGRSRRSVAKLLGVAESTVRRWVSTQEGEQHARQQSD